MNEKVNKNGMSIVGEGRKIILFMLPSLLAAILMNVYLPRVAALPDGLGAVRPLGYLLLVLGLVLWGAGILQLKRAFPEGRLVTTGAYGVVRHPIYAGMALFVLPGVALVTLTWVYLVASVFLCAGVVLFVGKEEEQLVRVFGKEYEDYKARVGGIVPMKSLIAHT